ncbi:uncharacterized protein EI97DRAFT_459889 [Westerdykella ornata]|uniref:Lipocalin-like domain-containing protein n=1 Tax=Westerdykella ornata TaxID=318751 RepID=A0A6A6JI58_WESOR|nr:uncharacterized protein EI97DRAFT_459889 [Westerdykella ornata]KAF2274939.1 hypothetical protein EI97DRAFT_459889 [Westerdykella ornata]
MSPPSIYHVLSGAWILLNNTVRYDNGTEGPSTGPTGPHDIGFLHYTSTGYMAANFMSSVPEHRPLNISWPRKETDRDIDWAQIGLHTFTYAGPYSVNPWNETHGNLTHGPLVYAGMPYMVGTKQSRNYTLLERGDMLRVTARQDSNNSTGRLIFRRGKRTN